MKRRIIVTLGLVMVVAGLVFGASALADESTSTSPAPEVAAAAVPGAAHQEAFLARAASILGVDGQELKDAFKQAGQELVAERINQMLDRAVAAGKLTPEQASEIKEWLQNRPEGLSKLPAARKFQGALKALKQGINPQALLPKVAVILGIDEQALKDAIAQAKTELANEVLGARLDALVEKGVITPEQADEAEAWWSARPDFLPQGFPQIGPGKAPMRPRMHIGGRGFMQGRPFLPQSGETGLQRPAVLNGLPGTGA